MHTIFRLAIPLIFGCMTHVVEGAAAVNREYTAVSSSVQADQKLEQKIIDKLKDHPRIKGGTNVQVKARDGQVTLDGVVEYAGDIEAIDKILHGIFEISAVTNNLGTPKDKALTAKIRQLLMDNHELTADARLLKVRVANGAVELQGTIQTAAEAAKVLALVNDFLQRTGSTYVVYDMIEKREYKK